MNNVRDALSGLATKKCHQVIQMLKRWDRRELRN